MRLDDVDELDLWRAEAILERMIRLQTAAFGGLAPVEIERGARVDSTAKTKRQNAWHGGEVIEDAPQTTETDRYRKTVKRTRVRWRGANKPTPAQKE